MSFESDFVLYFYKDEVLVDKQENTISLPAKNDVRLLAIPAPELQYTGTFNGNNYFAANIPSKTPYAAFTFEKLRNLSDSFIAQHWRMIFRAYHLIHWLKNNKFCGHCGYATAIKSLPHDFSVRCPLCNHIEYPRISPAIIVSVIKDQQILLAHSTRFPAGRYSVLAGFVEPGETLEDCVRREIREEVGIEVTNIKYFGSQPWPFPDSVMIAFTAQYANGEIKVDNDEIAAAGWFSATELPEIPAKGSISRKLIDAFVNSSS
jgi:NAD+ diphosphatase